MIKKLMILLASLVIIGFTIPAFAETYQVIITEGSPFNSTCAETDSCLSPSHLTINKGDTINWIREDDISHFIRSGSPGPVWDKQFQTMDYSKTFFDIGTYPYHSVDFPWIQGEIVVDYPNEKHGNYIEFTTLEIRGNAFLMRFQGHADGPAEAKVFNQDGYKGVIHLTKTRGFFSNNWGFTEQFGRAIDGIYRVEFYVVDEQQGKTFLDHETTFRVEIEPEGNTTHEIRILDGSLDKKCGTSCVDPPVLHILRGDKIKFVYDDCEGCHHMTVKIHDEASFSQSYLDDLDIEEYRWWDQTTWTYYDRVNPWITGQFVVGAGESTSEPEQIIEEQLPELKIIESDKPIPDWVRGVFTFWAEGNISDAELKNAIKFLVNNGVIVL